MSLLSANLDELDRATLRATIAFLNGRLEERATVDWALRPNANQRIVRLALRDLIASPGARQIAEPWRSAWDLIADSWNTPSPGYGALGAEHGIRRRLRAGERSGSLVAAIVQLVAPRLEVAAFSDLHPNSRRPSKQPRSVGDLLSAGLTSGQLVDPDILELGSLSDRSFLMSLTLALDSAVADGLDAARRIRGDEDLRTAQIGGLYRAYYVSAAKRSGDDHEPDQFHRGIAPSVKLLHAVVSRLVDVDLSRAVESVRRWRLSDSPVHLRLWAALSRDAQITPADDASEFLLALDDRCFWDVHEFPEIAELRAARFGEFDAEQQAALIARVRKLPPRHYWPRRAISKAVRDARIYWAVRELQRIEIAGSPLPHRDKAWMDSRIRGLPQSSQVARLDDGFPCSPESRFVPPNPDSKYDLLAGEDRLKALEAALSSGRRTWSDSPSDRAADWIRQEENSVHLLADLESAPNKGARFGAVWEQFGWAHSPTIKRGEHARDLPMEGGRVLSLLAKLPEATVRQAIDGISSWFSNWQTEAVAAPQALNVWLKLWPIAAEATNASRPFEEETDRSLIAQPSDDGEPMDIATLNTPAGRLVGVFLAACPSLTTNARPFDAGSTLSTMRNAIFSTTGRSSMISRHRLIEELPYFLRSDRDWTREHLVTPLIVDTAEAIPLWRAIARRTRFSEVLMIIGGPMTERANDRRLGRESRRSLAFSLIIECLHAFREQRQPAVPYARIQQMIRLLEDEVRAFGAEAIQRFVREASTHGNDEEVMRSPEHLFRSAALPFLQKVWPQERSLATPGVSAALAGLPATAGEAFGEAVNAIERFLVPTECWSMLEYRLYGDEGGTPKLSLIDNEAKASALLRLLDLTIGTGEDSVVPYDIARALDQVRKVAPKLTESRAFERLATAARRV